MGVIILKGMQKSYSYEYYIQTASERSRSLKFLPSGRDIQNLYAPPKVPTTNWGLIPPKFPRVYEAGLQSSG